MRNVLFLILALALAGCVQQSRPTSPAVSAQPITQVPTIYVTRHMRKATGEDPSLSSEGRVEAVRLAELLKDRGITVIFVTATKRSRETAEPLAVATGARIEPYDPRDNAALAQRAAAIPDSILIVGHSNTVPDIVAAVGGRSPGPMNEDDYGRIFAVERATGKTVETRL